MSLVHAAEFIAPEPGALGGGHAEHAILVMLFGQRRVAIEVLERPGTGHCANGAGANRKRRSNSPCREEKALGWELYARGAGRGGDGRGRPGWVWEDWYSRGECENYNMTSRSEPSRK